jgi:hypothetical protein
MSELRMERKYHIPGPGERFSSECEFPNPQDTTLLVCQVNELVGGSRVTIAQLRMRMDKESDVVRVQKSYSAGKDQADIDDKLDMVVSHVSRFLRTNT